MRSAAKRLYAREAKRRESARRYAAARARAQRCPWRQGRYGVCGGFVEIIVERDGRTVSRCARCERREAGICQDCPRPVEGLVRRALRCAQCKQDAHRRHRRVYYHRHREEKLAAWRERMRDYRAARPWMAEESRVYQRELRRQRKLCLLHGGVA